MRLWTADAGDIGLLRISKEAAQPKRKPDVMQGKNKEETLRQDMWHFIQKRNDDTDH